MDNNNMMNNGFESQPYSQPTYSQPAPQGGTNVKAILALVFGILSILTCCCYGVVSIILGIVGIVMAVLAKKDNMGQFPGMAIAGLVCSIIGILLGVAYWVLFLIGISADPSILNEYM